MNSKLIICIFILVISLTTTFCAQDTAANNFLMPLNPAANPLKQMQSVLKYWKTNYPKFDATS